MIAGKPLPPAVRAEFEDELPFPLDPFQIRALDAVDRGESVLVAAPTGSGKTVIAEYAVAAALAGGKKAFYTTPIKALSNQKFNDLRERHGRDRVGLLTGDNSINGEASVVVMTTEVLRNMIYSGSTSLDRLGVVVLDEVHYLQDPYRGAVWEEVIIHLNPEVRLVCLSATVSNAEEFGDWLATVRGRTDVVIEEQRPVELSHLYGVSLREADEMLFLPVFVEERGGLVPNPRAGEFDPIGIGGRGERRGRATRSRPVAPRRVDVVDELEQREMLPAIYFLFSRAGCTDAVQQLQAARVRLNDEGDSARVRAIAEAHCAGLSDGDLAALGYGPWLSALESGVASHHAGMVPPMKEAVEEAFIRGLVKVVFATETLALGINMPARSVVIERLTKFTGERHEFLTPGEYTQLTGRAGRRGIDDLGYGVVLWNRFARFDQIAGLASRRTYELRSSFRPTYNMAVNLVRSYARDQAHHLLNLSFAQYRIDREVVTLERRTEDIQRRLDEARSAAACERGDIDDYRKLLAEVDGARQRQRGGSDDKATRLARLRAGDVIEGGRGIGRAVVIQKSSARGGSPRVTGLDERGRLVRLGPTSFREGPETIGRLRLPEPYRPKNPAFRREVAHRLRRADFTPPRSRRAEAERGRDRPTTPATAPRKLGRHPVAGCPELGRHLDAARRADRIERDLATARRRTEGHGETLSRRFDLVLEVLARRGYVRGWDLTDRGELLSRIYTEGDLLVAEAATSGLFDGLTPSELAALVSIFTYETRGPEESVAPRWPTAEIARRAHRVEDTWLQLRDEESAAGLPETRQPDGGFAFAAHAWASGRDLEGVLGDEELTGGDFVRSIKRLIDLLRQIGDAASDPRTRDAARSAADALFRGVVEASSRVGA